MTCRRPATGTAMARRRPRTAGPYTQQPWPLDTGEVQRRRLRAGVVHHDRPVLVHRPRRPVSGSTPGRHGRGDAPSRQGRPRPFTVETRTPQRHRVRRAHPVARSTATTSASSASRPRATPPSAQYAKPLWNSWAQFYTKVSQEKLLDYATDLHDSGVPGHTIQLDDKWSRTTATSPSRRSPIPRGSPEDPRHGLRLRHLGHPVDQPGLRQLPVRGRQGLPAESKDTAQAVRSDLVERPGRDHRPGQPRSQGLVRGQLKT